MPNGSGWLLGLVLAVAGFGLGQHLASTSGTPADPPAEPGQGVIVERTEIQVRDELLGILAEPEERTRAARLVEWIPTLAPDAIGGIERVFRNRSVRPGVVAHVLLVEFWAQHDPKAAAAWTATFAPKGYASAVSAVAVQEWAKAEPLEALELLAPAGYAPLDVMQQRELARGWFRSGQQSSLERWMRRLGMGMEQQRVLSVFAQEMIQRDGADAAIAWAESVDPRGDPHYRRFAFSRVAQELARVDPPAALAFCEKHCDEEHGKGMRLSIAQMWPWLDGPAALEWIRTIPDERDRELSIKDALRIWRNADIDGLRAWFEAQAADGVPVPAWLVPGLGLFASAVAQEGGDWRTGLEWAERIPDEAKRTMFLVRLARRWHRADPEAASAWLETSPLSEEDRVRAVGKEALPALDPEDAG